jgi:hypothetical protein
MRCSPIEPENLAWLLDNVGWLPNRKDVDYSSPVIKAKIPAFDAFVNYPKDHVLVLSCRSIAPTSRDPHARLAARLEKGVSSTPRSPATTRQDRRGAEGSPPPTRSMHDPQARGSLRRAVTRKRWRAKRADIAMAGPAPPWPRAGRVRIARRAGGGMSMRSGRGLGFALGRARRRCWLVYVAVRVYPIAETLRLSLHNWNIISPRKPFIGLANFEELMGDPLFHRGAAQHRRSSPTAVLVDHRAAGAGAGGADQPPLRLAARRRVHETAIFIPHVVSASSPPRWRGNGCSTPRLGPLNWLHRPVRASPPSRGCSIRRWRSSASSCCARGRRSAIRRADPDRRHAQRLALALRGGAARRGERRGNCSASSPCRSSGRCCSTSRSSR